jgi:hypothetical protein
MAYKRRIRLKYRHEESSDAFQISFPGRAAVPLAALVSML